MLHERWGHHCVNIRRLRRTDKKQTLMRMKGLLDTLENWVRRVRENKLLLNRVKEMWVTVSSVFKHILMFHHTKAEWAQGFFIFSSRQTFYQHLREHKHKPLPLRMNTAWKWCFWGTNTSSALTHRFSTQLLENPLFWTTQMSGFCSNAHEEQQLVQWLVTVSDGGFSTTREGNLCSNRTTATKK